MDQYHHGFVFFGSLRSPLQRSLIWGNAVTAFKPLLDIIIKLNQTYIY